MRRRASFAILMKTGCASAALFWLAGLSIPSYGQAAPKASASMAPMPGMQSKKAAPESIQLTVIVAGNATTFTPDDLDAMPQTTVKVHNAHTKADESYTGVLLSELISKAGFAVNSATQSEMLHSYVQAEGTDHYWVLYSLTETEPTESTGKVIVAMSVDGHGLGADGQLKLVSTEDTKPERWVRNLATITVKSAQ